MPVPFLLGKNSTGKHDCDSRHFQPTLCHRTVDDHLFPHDQICDAKETRGEWWTSCVSQQNDSKWAEDMGKREYKSQYPTKPKFSHGTRWTVLKSGRNRVNYCGFSYAGERGAELCLKAWGQLYDPRKITTRNNMYLGNCCNFCSMLVIFLSIRRKASKEINENLHHHVWY